MLSLHSTDADWEKFWNNVTSKLELDIQWSKRPDPCAGMTEAEINQYIGDIRRRRNARILEQMKANGEY